MAAALDSADPDLSTDLLMGIGAAPESHHNTALRGLDVFEELAGNNNPEHERRATEMVGDKLRHVWGRDELCSSKDSVYIVWRMRRKGTWPNKES